MMLFTAKLFPVAFPIFSAMSTQAHHTLGEGNTCSSVRYPPPSVRPPPKDGYHGHNFVQWTPPPPETLYGTYYITHSSYDYLESSIVNLWVERYPILPVNNDFPSGSEAEIESWSTCSDLESTDCEDPNAISTIFGYDIPTGAQGPTDKKYTAAWSYAATGVLEGVIQGLRAVTAWGEDDNGVGYFVQYENGTDVNGDYRDGVIIASRNQEGISSSTYICVSSSLKQLAEELNDEDLSATVSRIKPLPHDHRRDGAGPVECDKSCMNNTAFGDHDSQRPRRRNTPDMQLPLNYDGTYKRMLYPLGIRRGGYLPWWGWMTMGLVFGIPLLGGLCVAVPVAVLRGHRRRKFARAQRQAQGISPARGSSSVAEPEMVETA